MMLDIRDPQTHKLLLRYDPECRMIQLWVKDYDKSTGRHQMVQKYVDLTQFEDQQTTEQPDSDPPPTEW